MKKLTILLCILFVFLIFPLKNVEAADLNVECSASSGCQMSGEKPLFSKSLDGVWYPGRAITKTLNVKNTGSESREMRLKATKNTSNDLEDVMNIEFSSNAGVIWTGVLNDFLDEELSLGDFKAGEDRDYFLKASMNESADNYYQGKSSIFDLTVGIWQETSGTNQTSSGGDGSSQGSNTSNNPITSLVSVLSANTQNIIDNLISTEKEIEKSEGSGQEVLGGKIGNATCSYGFWRQSTFILLFLLIILLLYILRNKIKNILLRKKD